MVAHSPSTTADLRGRDVESEGGRRGAALSGGRAAVGASERRGAGRLRQAAPVSHFTLWSLSTRTLRRRSSTMTLARRRFLRACKRRLSGWRPPAGLGGWCGLREEKGGGANAPDFQARELLDRSLRLQSLRHFRPGRSDVRPQRLESGPCLAANERFRLGVDASVLPRPRFLARLVPGANGVLALCSLRSHHSWRLCRRLALVPRRLRCCCGFGGRPQVRLGFRNEGVQGSHFVINLLIGAADASRCPERLRSTEGELISFPSPSHLAGPDSPAAAMHRTPFVASQGRWRCGGGSSEADAFVN